MPKIFVAGEALIDLITVGGSSSAHVGGGPANTAKALARLGLESFFVGGISSDEYGALIESELLESGVDLSLVLRGDKPTALARAQVDERGVASYSFELEGTTTFDFSSAWLPSGDVEIVHVGTLATLVEPGANALFKWVSELGVPVVFDPNVRPSVLSDKDLYRAVIEKWVAISNVVKLSSDDLQWLYEDESVIQNWLDGGVSLVVVTMGDAGLRAHSAGFEVTVPGAEISLVDTVGAGDTVGAVLVEGIVRFGLSGLNNSIVLREVLERAAVAAGITCSRAGANPPWKSELD